MRRRAGEEGATLALALVVVLLASLIGLGMANLVVSSASFSKVSSADRQATFAADGAADWTISRVTQALNQGDPAPCAPTAFLDYQSMSASCGPAPSSGAPVVTGSSTTTTTTAGGGPASAPTTSGPVTYTFTVINSATGVTYVTATVMFSTGLDGQVHAAVQSWVDRPTH